VTKSGGNAIHGDLFEFVRTYIFNARNTFQPVRDNQKRNQFGGTMGGPIKKDKLFYFLGYQGTLTRAAFPTTNFVPTAAMYNGDFAQCSSFKFNPGFSSTVPGSSISSFALKLRPSLPTTNRATKWLLSDWKTSVSLNIRSGMNLTVTTGIDRALNGATGNQRPNLVLSDPYLPNKGQNGWLNKLAFAQPDFGTYGNLGIGNILGPGAISLNLALSRIFKITEKQQLEIRGEAFNLPNLVNLYNPATALSAPNFGQLVPATNNLNTGAAPPSPANDPRIMQFALKYIFLTL
jgi:hypothetical protein